MTAKRYRTSSQVRFNLKLYLDREFVNDGQYINVESGHFAVNGQRADVLTEVNPRRYASSYTEWVGDTDHDGCDPYPTIVASGVTIDGQFHERGSAPYFPQINYENGEVIFGVDVPANSTVETTFSAKRTTFDFPDSDVANLLYTSIKDNVDFATTTIPSGIERQLPLVIIDDQSRSSVPYQLGGGQILNQSVILHVIANNPVERDQICDLLQDEKFRKVIQGVDFNVAPQRFSQTGDRASTYVSYTDMQASGALAWSRMYVDTATIREKSTFRGYHNARVDWNLTIYRLPGT